MEKNLPFSSYYQVLTHFFDTMCVQLCTIISRVKRRRSRHLNFSTAYILRWWHGVDYANQGRSWGDVDTLDYNVIEAYPLLCSTSDMTKVQILRWALSRFRMEGYPCYCLIEISVSSKKPRPLNSFQGKDSPGPLFFFSHWLESRHQINVEN